VSLPDDVSEQAERLAKRRSVHRDEIMADAPREYVARHDPDVVTEALNRVANRKDPDVDPWLRAAARRALERVEW